jgi:nucleoside-diphosphate-sugar epimerase
MSTKVLILGVNGFIGHHLSARILKDTDWSVFGMDMSADRIEPLLANPRMKFFEGDITINKEWIEYHIRKCDVVLPLVAIATPATYVREPLRVFELDFEANLPIIRQCVRHGKRVLFPSTSEVYGMCRDSEFDPESSELVYGPIEKQRWIYACSKQSAKEGSSRVITQFLGHIVRGEPIKLVDGGGQKRCFTGISDGIDALMKIIENKGGCATRKIFNIGNPNHNYSVRELAEMLLKMSAEYPEYAVNARRVKLVDTTSGEYYGKGYQDVANRVPKIENTCKDLGWEPRVSMREAMQQIFEAYRGQLPQASGLLD